MIVSSFSKKIIKIIAWICSHDIYNLLTCSQSVTVDLSTWIIHSGSLDAQIRLKIGSLKASFVYFYSKKDEHCNIDE